MGVWGAVNYFYRFDFCGGYSRDTKMGNTGICGKRRPVEFDAGYACAREKAGSVFLIGIVQSENKTGIQILDARFHF